MKKVAEILVRIFTVFWAIPYLIFFVIWVNWGMTFYTKLTGKKAWNPKM